MRKVKALVLVSVLSFLAAPMMVGAIEDIPSAESGITVAGIYEKIQDLFKYAYWVAFGLCVVYIVWGLVQWATAGGDDEKMKAARKKLLFGVVAAALISVIRTVISLIADYFFKA